VNVPADVGDAVSSDWEEKWLLDQQENVTTPHINNEIVDVASDMTEHNNVQEARVVNEYDGRNMDLLNETSASALHDNSEESAQNCRTYYDSFALHTL